MKVGSLNLNAVEFPPGNEAGMTLIEVVIALVIAAMTVGGVISGYIYCTTASVKAELAQAANARAMERIEQARSAQWDVSSWPVVDQLVSSNFPDQVVSLDMAGTNSGGTTATIQTTIAQISAAPPLRKVHVDCIWRFNGGPLVTNSVETCRAPDQ